jgi:hypothetical protein
MCVIPANLVLFLYFFALIFKETFRDTYLMVSSVRLWIVQNEHRKYTRIVPESWQVGEKAVWCMAPASMESLTPLLPQMILLTTNKVTEWLPIIQCFFFFFQAMPAFGKFMNFFYCCLCILLFLFSFTVPEILVLSILTSVEHFCCLILFCPTLFFNQGTRFPYKLEFYSH